MSIGRKSGVNSSSLPEKMFRHQITPTGLRPGVVGQPVIVSHNWASMNLESWAKLSVATVTVSLEPTDNRAWAARMQSPSNTSGPAVGNPALRAEPTVRQPAA